ncbi:hypothetical protein GCM10010430_81360 [Kitasatospora cystarginea]|uniref:Uncharacterized protein n=1 Tax=Kitasatospora cystarginea TaxID=58350 RepID=A0ABN3F2X8_9ACTN
MLGQQVLQRGIQRDPAEVVGRQARKLIAHLGPHLYRRHRHTRQDTQWYTIGIPGIPGILVRGAVFRPGMQQRGGATRSMSPLTGISAGQGFNAAVVLHPVLHLALQLLAGLSRAKEP